MYVPRGNWVTVGYRSSPGPSSILSLFLRSCSRSQGGNLRWQSKGDAIAYIYTPTKSIVWVTQLPFSMRKSMISITVSSWLRVLAEKWPFRTSHFTPERQLHEPTQHSMQYIHTQKHMFGYGYDKSLYLLCSFAAMFDFDICSTCYFPSIHPSCSYAFQLRPLQRKKILVHVSLASPLPYLLCLPPSSSHSSSHFPGFRSSLLRFIIRQKLRTLMLNNYNYPIYISISI